jgi:hypothetical protein
LEEEAAVVQEGHLFPGGTAAVVVQEGIVQEI